MWHSSAMPVYQRFQTLAVIWFCLRLRQEFRSFRSGSQCGVIRLNRVGFADRTVYVYRLLPRERKDIVQQLQALQSAQGTLLFYESPHRVKKTLEVLQEVLGNRKVTLARELTKRYEEFVRGSISECLDWLTEHPPLGEYCLVVQAGSVEEEQKEKNSWWQELSLEEHVGHYEREGLSRKDAMKNRG